MSIRLKITLGFALLTVVIVSSVSFWAAQSLGFSIDSSDIQKLEAYKRQIMAHLASEQKIIDRICVDSARSFADLDMVNQPLSARQRFSESLKSTLELDWLEVYHNGRPLLTESQTIRQPLPNSATLQRIADSGPYSYDGYLVAYASVASDTSVYVARRPDFSSLAVPMFCIFDRKGILKSHNFSGSLAYLSKLQREKVTGQLEDQDQLFRVRVFEIQPGYFILTGYPAQRAMISRTDIDMLMLRLAVLQVLGLLILGYFLGRRLLAPLRALGMGIEKVAEGDWKEIPLDQPPMQGSGDEIESVALSFNKMVRELSSAQTRLIEVQKELAKKDKLAALGRFSAGIAHEINNPLGTILVNAGLLKESLEKGHEISVEEVEEIADEVKRCKNIISTLRTYTTQTQPVLSEYDFNEAFRQLTDYISGLAEYKAITFKISDQANGRIRIDMAAMKQVFANLVKNAADAMSDNKYKELVISAVNESDHFAISFCDNGKGFECEPELIFEPLFTTKAQGTGLGLIICQAIIEGHNGKIEARRLDEMTELKILLPFTADRDNTAEETL